MTEFIITPGLLLTLMIAVAAAIAVYLDTKRRSSETPLRVDLYMAITAGAAVATVLMRKRRFAACRSLRDPR